MPELNPKLVATLGAVVVDVVQWLLHHGQPAGNVAVADVKRIAAEAAQAAVEEAWATLREEGMVLACDALGDAAHRLLDELKRLDALYPPHVTDVDMEVHAEPPRVDVEPESQPAWPVGISFDLPK